MLAIDRLRGGAGRFQPFGGTFRKLSVVFDVLWAGKGSRLAGAKAISNSVRKAAAPGDIRSCRTNTQSDRREVM